MDSHGQHNSASQRPDGGIQPTPGIAQGLQSGLHLGNQLGETGRWLTTDEAAAYAGVSTKTIHRAVVAGHLLCGRLKRQFRFRPEWIDAWLMAEAHGRTVRRGRARV